MSGFYDIIYRGKDVNQLNYNFNGEKYGYYSFTRKGELEANHQVNELRSQGYEAYAIYVGKPRNRDIDD